MNAGNTMDRMYEQRGRFKETRNYKDILIGTIRKTTLIADCIAITLN